MKTATLAVLTLGAALIQVGALGALPGPPPAADLTIKTEDAKLVPSDGEPGDQFGRNVSISDDTVIVGNHIDAGAAGAAYVFGRHFGGPGNWGQVKKLTAGGDASANDQFGIAVGVSGGTAVVGAHAEDPAGIADAGAAYVFDRDRGGANQWGMVAKLVASDAFAEDFFGLAAGISGDAVVVGAFADDDAGSGSGSAYVFERDFGAPDNWGQVKKLVGSDAGTNSQFGLSVAISGDTLVVGAFGHLSARGAAYVFERGFGGPGNWGEVKRLLASDGIAGDQFGARVAIDGDVIVVGAYAAGPAGSASGAAYVYQRNLGGANNWGQAKKLVPSDAAANDQFGLSAAAAGDMAVVGAYADDHSGVSDAGSAYVFERNRGGPNNWGESVKLIASDVAADQWFAGTSTVLGGAALAASGRSVVAGAHSTFFASFGSQPPGAAYVFDLGRSLRFFIAEARRGEPGALSALARRRVDSARRPDELRSLLSSSNGWQ